MDEERRTKIATALHQYRETVAQHNFFLLRIIVEDIEAQPVQPGYSARVAQVLRMRGFQRYLGGAVPESVKSPRDLLNDDNKDEYFAAIRTRIAEKNVKVAEFPPADLEYLCTLVSGITGPGLPFDQEVQQCDFVSTAKEASSSHFLDSIIVPIRDDEGEGYDSFTYLWEDWKIAIAVKIGGGLRSWGGSYVLYCRNEVNEQWKWRYGLHDDDWCSDVYDSVEEFPGFYAHCKEPTEEEARKDIRRFASLRKLV